MIPVDFSAIIGHLGWTLMGNRFPYIDFRFSENNKSSPLFALDALSASQSACRRPYPIVEFQTETSLHQRVRFRVLARQQLRKCSIKITHHDTDDNLHQKKIDLRGPILGGGKELLKMKDSGWTNG